MKNWYLIGSGNNNNDDDMDFTNWNGKYAKTNQSLIKYCSNNLQWINICK